MSAKRSYQPRGGDGGMMAALVLTALLWIAKASDVLPAPWVAVFAPIMGMLTAWLLFAIIGAIIIFAKKERGGHGPERPHQ